MKQFKFSMLALIVLMGVSFSSCIKSDDGDESYTLEHLVKVRNGYAGTYFTDAAGNQLHPTLLSLTEVEGKGFKPLQTKMAYIYYKIAETGTTDTKGTEGGKKIVAIELLGAVSMDGDQIITEEGSEDDVEATAPILGLEYEGTVRLTPFMFDDNTLVLPVFWLMGNGNELLAQHKFTIVFHPEKVEEGATEMVLQLRHDKGEDTKNDVRTWVWRCYDISTMLLEFTARAGVEKPAKITIETMESMTSVNITDPTCKKNTYSISYDK